MTLLDCSPPGSSVYGIAQARILEWVAVSSSREPPDSGLEPSSPALAGIFVTAEPPGESQLRDLRDISVWGSGRFPQLLLWSP